MLAQQRVGVAAGGATPGEIFADFVVEGYSSVEQVYRQAVFVTFGVSVLTDCLCIRALGKLLEQTLGSAGANGSVIAKEAVGGVAVGGTQGKSSPKPAKRGGKGVAVGGEGESGSGVAVERQGIELTFCVFPGAELSEASSEVPTPGNASAIHRPQKGIIEWFCEHIIPLGIFGAGGDFDPSVGAQKDDGRAIDPSDPRDCRVRPQGIRRSLRCLGLF